MFRHGLILPTEPAVHCELVYAEQRRENFLLDVMLLLICDELGDDVFVCHAQIVSQIFSLSNLFIDIAEIYAKIALILF